MVKIVIQIKEFFLNLFFPVFCLNCQKERSYLCQDCYSLIDIVNYQYVFDNRDSGSCKKDKNLSGLFSATSYENFIIKKLIAQFKYPPYVKDLSKTLSSLIITYFQLIENCPLFRSGLKEEALIPIPLTRKKLKERGFNQAEELAKELSNFFKLPLLSNVLIKTKETLDQIELSGKERKENIIGAFFCQEPEKVKNKKIVLVDDVFTTGATIEEAAKILKMAGAREVWGIVVARGE